MYDTTSALSKTLQFGAGVCDKHLTQCPYVTSLQQLKQQRDKLRQYQKRISLQLEKERLLAKQLLKDGKKE